ncbi:hypothetical protein TNCV_1457991 [Trichonephila clavipes]|nr:hypothetical protein TNCV_1457991 [Trichonephila clavipes]
METCTYAMLRDVSIRGALQPPYSELYRILQRLLGLGSNPEEGMHVCKYIVPLWYGDTLNSRRAASTLVILVERKRGWEAPDHPQMFFLKIEEEPNKIVLSPVWCLKLRRVAGVNLYPVA